jgi:uncharacterized membrane protein HdeD (DUF308 family)
MEELIIMTHIFKSKFLVDPRGAGWSIAISILMIVAGFFAIVSPSLAGITVTFIVGWLLIINGFAHFGFAWHSRGAGGIAWEGLIGILYLFLGGYLLIHPFIGAESLTLALAIYLVVKGALEFILSFQLRPFSGSGWLLVDGIITFILAVIIWRMWPLNSLFVIGTLVGISILFGGIARLMLSLAVRRLAIESA